MGTLPRFLAHDRYAWTGPTANEAPLYVRSHDGRESPKTKPQVLGTWSHLPARCLALQRGFALHLN